MVDPIKLDVGSVRTRTHAQFSPCRESRAIRRPMPKDGVSTQLTRLIFNPRLEDD